MTYITDFKYYKWACNLVRPKLGFWVGLIIGKTDDDNYVVQFNDGSTETLSPNEIYFD